jgi:predicted lipoprotein with Yx(FWY)xxD motif
MNLKYLFAIFSVITVLLSACAPSFYGLGSNRSNNSDSLSVGSKADVGEYLVASNGFTLYTFAQDVSGSSTCKGDCAVKWPPLLETTSLPTGVGGTLSTVAREDGSRQVTYDGKPLYFFAGDKAPGETNGHGVGSVWFAAKAVVVVTNSSGSSNDSSSSGYSY